MTSIYDITVKDRADRDVPLSDFKGKVLLIVNTATGCGFTPQYEGLESLYRMYHDAGLEVLDFPCNQFGHQAPGTDDEIHAFCTAKYDTTFDQFKKIEVNGPDASPLYAYLKAHAPKEFIEGAKNKLAMAGIVKISATCKADDDIKWNFTKFLVDREGNVVMRVSPIEKPEVMEGKIKELLGA